MTKVKQHFTYLPTNKGDWESGLPVHAYDRYYYLDCEFQALSDGLTNAPGQVVTNSSYPQGHVVANTGWKIVNNAKDGILGSEYAVQRCNVFDGRLTTVEYKIPDQASFENKLADKAFVNSSIATATATFRGSYNLVSDLQLTTSATEQQIAAALATAVTTKDNNDYVFVLVPTATSTPAEIARVDRYKYNGTAFAFEYSLNNSSFTAAQWAAINSGITTELVAAFNAKYDKPSGGIPKTDLSSAVQTSLEKADTAVQDVSGKEDKSNKVTSMSSGSTDTEYPSAKSVWSLIVSTIDFIKEWAESLFAKMQGDYPLLSVGKAKAIDRDEDVVGAFFSRTSGGDAEISNGVAQFKGVKGASVKVNQLVQNGNFANGTDNWSKYSTSITISAANNKMTVVTSGSIGADASSITQMVPVINEHKYFIKAKYTNVNNNSLTPQVEWTGAFNGVTLPVEGIIKTSGTSGNRVILFKSFGTKSNGDSWTWENIIVLDLTAMGIDSLTTVAQVEAWLAEHVGLQAYYDYNAGEVVNVNMTGIESIGRNLLDPTTGKAQILGEYDDTYGNYYGICGTHGTITFTDKLGNSETITPDSDGKFLLEVAGELSVADAGDDCSVFLWWDGSKTDYSDYQRSVGKLDVTHIWGKKNGTGSLVRVWPTGMPGIGELKDSLSIVDGAVVAKRIVGEVDLGSLSWVYNTNTSPLVNYFQAAQSGIKSVTASIIANIICAKYKTGIASVDGGQENRVASYNGDIIRVYDTSKTSSDLNNGYAQWLNSVLLYYELAIPETYTDLVYQGSEYFADGTPVTLPVPYEADNWGVENILPKNDSTIRTAMPTVTCRYAMDIAEEVDTQAQEIANLDENKANKAGDYPDIVSGSSRALTGNNPLSAEIINRKTGDPSTVASGIALFDAIRGKSLIWNQMCPIPEFSSETQFSNNIKFVNNGDGSVTVIVDTGGSTAERYVTLAGFDLVAGHKYYCPAGAYGNNSVHLRFVTYANGIFSVSDSANKGLRISVPNNTPAGTYKMWCFFFDLTLLFGSGHEPSTVAEFEKLYPLPYYAYNTGEIVNNAATGLEVVGFNQWDEEWVGGYWNANGSRSISSNEICTKNLIPVFPNTQYYLKLPATISSSSPVINYFDANKVLIDRPYITLSNGLLFTTPDSCTYIGVNFNQAYGTTYNNDICINLSNTSRNGTYEPYKKTTVALKIPTLTGKKIVNGSTEGQDSVTIFSDTVGSTTVVGMKGVGSAYDSIYKDENKVVRRAKKVFGVYVFTGSETTWTDIGNSKWNCKNILIGAAATGSAILSSKGDGAYLTNGQSYPNGISVTLPSSVTTEAQAKAYMEGAVVIYQLATPEEYILDEPLASGYQEDGDGVERRLPEDTSSAVLAPLAANITYPMDAVGTLNGLPKDYANVSTLDSLLAAMGTAAGGTFTKTWDETNQKYVIAFTPNA